MQNSRLTVAGIVGGVLALALLAGFAIGLPKAEGADLPTLPDKLADKVVAVSALTPEEAGVTDTSQIATIKSLADQAHTADTKGAAKLKELYGGDATVRSYFDLANRNPSSGMPNELAVSVVRTAPGLVFLSGPFAVDSGSTHYALKKIGDYQCAGIYADAQAATSTTAASPEQYGSSECRIESNGLTYDIFGSGVSMEQAAAYLKKVVGA